MLETLALAGAVILLALIMIYLVWAAWGILTLSPDSDDEDGGGGFGPRPRPRSRGPHGGQRLQAPRRSRIPQRGTRRPRVTTSR